MLIFNNMLRSGYEEVKSYGPSWWPEYREMDAVYHLAGWTLDLMAYWLDQIVLNQFPAYCDEESLKAFENLLGIEYAWDASEDERRRTVMMYLYSTGKLSKSTILAMIKAYTGYDGDVYWEGDTLVIQFNNDGDLDVSMGMLQKIIERRMPAHLGFATRCMCTVTLGVGPKSKAWKKYFRMCGTYPKTNTGLGISHPDIAVEPEGHNYRTDYPMAGDSGNAGTYPKISTELSVEHGNIAVDPETESTEVLYPMAGQSGNAGTYPKDSTGLSLQNSSGLIGAETESWAVSYKICGEDSL